MAIGPGSRIGPYEVTSLLGEGGMGKVWRAHHAALKRDDALKVLPDDVASDPDRLARFQREAQVLASLNHPNIARVYGFEQAEGVHALVMELVDGATLADRIGFGPLPLDEALPIARQIAEALDTAHEQGIVHRDLKPANVKLRPDGTVKVLDFGLAKLTGPDDSMPGGKKSGPHLSNSPTLTSPALMTRVGVILGTAAYMSPEQARGRPVDKRADVWAFGCVLFEMLTGRRVFDGDDVTDTLASVVKSDPPWSALPAATPPAIRRLLERCLRKDTGRRLRDIADAKLEIDDALAGPVAITPARGNRERLFWIAALAASMAALAVVSVAYLRRSPQPQPELRLQIVTPPGSETELAMAPDGRSVVFSATTDGKTELWVRALSVANAQVLPGTAGAERPFWSPDSRSIGFFADQKLKRIEIASGTVQTLADASVSRGGAWGDGTIIFAPANISPLMRIPARGGAAVEATHLAEGQVSHRLPVFLPDGKRFLFFVTGTSAVQGVYLGSLDSDSSRRVLEGESSAVFTAPDLLLFRGESALMAQRVDVQTFETIGEPAAIAETVATRANLLGSIAVSGSAAGAFAYRSDVPSRRQFVWLSRDGTRIGTIGEPDETLERSERAWQLSPDGRLVVVQRRINNNADLWLIDVARGVARRWVTSPASESYPMWSPDSTRIAFGSSRLHGSVVHDLFVKSIAGAQNETTLLESAENKAPTSWSRDGRFLMYSVLSAKTGNDLWVLPLDGGKKPFAFAETPSHEQSAAFSPDGRWVAYDSNETGRFEIYVQQFPGPATSTPVSTGGGTSPMWGNDGREIVYRGPDNRVMAIPVSIGPSGVNAGTPVPLFTLPSTATLNMTPDGKRFLVNAALDDAAMAPITVVLNWKAPRQ